MSQYEFEDYMTGHDNWDDEDHGTMCGCGCNYPTYDDDEFEYDDRYDYSEVE